MYKKILLANGIRIVAHPMKGMESAALGIWINTGGRYEDAPLKGISHYLEHLLFKGSRRYSCRKIKESIEGVGGSLNGFTSEELTCFLVKIPAQHLDAALDVLSDMTIHPLLAQEDIERERTVILEEIKMYKDLPQSYVHELLDELLWPAQPLGMSIMGSEESVSRINRDDLVAYQKSRYTPANIVVSVCGKFSLQAFCRRVAKTLGPLEAGAKNVPPAVMEAQDAPRLRVFHKETEQTHLALGFHAFRRDHPLRHAAGLLHIILGGNMSSRLFNEVRENKGLAYEIGTHLKRFRDTGAFLVHAGIDNLKVEEALRLILAELARTTEELVSRDEFKRAREFYLGQLRLALEDTLEHMLWIGESVATLDRTYSLAEVVKEVNQVGRRQIREAARCLFRNARLNLALIGPLQERQDRIRKELTF